MRKEEVVTYYKISIVTDSENSKEQSLGNIFKELRGDEKGYSLVNREYRDLRWEIIFVKR